MAIDKIYEGKTKEDIIDLIYTFHLQNTNGRESPDEMFKLGIEACYNELCAGESWNENSGLHKHVVTNRTCSNCHHCVTNPVSRNEHDKYKCFAREHTVSISNIEKYVCDKWAPL